MCSRTKKTKKSKKKRWYKVRYTADAMMIGESDSVRCT